MTAEDLVLALVVATVTAYGARLLVELFKAVAR